MLTGAEKGERERIIITAHQAATMMGHLHSKGGLKALSHYLRKVKAAPKAGDATVLLSPEERAQLRQMRKKG